MEKEEIIEKAKRKKCLVGEMENAKIQKSNWIAVIVACIVAVAFCFSESIFARRPAYFAIMAIIFAWATTFYIGQFTLAKRPWQVLIGAVLYGLAFIAMIVLYVIANVKGW